MTEEQEKHLQTIKDNFVKLVDSKYRSGVIEHGGNLWEKQGIIDMLLEELIDGVTYALTLKEQIKEMGGERKRKGRVILVDFDGVLCHGESFTIAQAEQAEPIKRTIEKVNLLYISNFIVIYTARADEMILASLDWLKKNGVKFHAFSNFKCPADVYLDDKAVGNIDDLLEFIV